MLHKQKVKRRRLKVLDEIMTRMINNNGKSKIFAYAFGHTHMTTTLYQATKKQFDQPESKSLTSSLFYIAYMGNRCLLHEAISIEGRAAVAAAAVRL
jgi:hypothetical protein